MRKLSVVCRLAMVSMFLMSMLACNQDLADCPSEKNDIPISVSDYSRIQSRVSGSSFDEEDKIGLYVLEQPFTLSETRHVDNMSFQLQGNEWIGESKIYYPASAGLCDFVAYYPYQAGGLSQASSVYTLNVKRDQSMLEDYSTSDFLVAEKKDVFPSVEPVQLIFKHKLVEVVIELLPGSAYESAQELLQENPQVFIKGASTQVDYDFISGEFSNEDITEDVIPFGSFTVKGERLVGVAAILVPQTIAADKVFIEIKVAGRVYGFTFGEIHSLSSATRETYTLTIRKNGSVEGTIETTIEDWENETSWDGDLTEIEDNDNGGNGNTYEISLPDFSSSSVYKVMDGNKLLAEVCREYLKGENINKQAVVIYPVIEDEIDYTNGFVAQILDGYAGNPLTESVHGGSVRWNISSNTFVYEAGTLGATAKVYINKDGEIGSVAPPSSLAASLIADVIKEERDNYQYGIVKIGMQYWMQENLKATVLRGGIALTDATELETWTNIQSKSLVVTAAYCQDWQNESVLYNYAAVESENLVPEGWAVPSSADWNKLKAYTADLTTLVSLNWEVGNNLSGFSVEGYGYRNKLGEHIKLQKAYFWANAEVRYEITETSNLKSENSKADGNNIRCIRN